MSDYLTDEEQMARLKSWWDENGTSTIVALVLVIAGIAGWRWYGDYRADAIAKASDLYQEFLVSQGVARDTIAAKIASEVPDTAYHALALMHLARDAIGNGDYDVAGEHLQHAISAAPRPVLADVARLRLATVQQQGDRSDAALRTLGAVRGEGFRSHVAELKGDIHLARGERLLAHESYTAAFTGETNQNRRPILEMKIADTADSIVNSDLGSNTQQEAESADSDADSDADSIEVEVQAPDA